MDIMLFTQDGLIDIQNIIVGLIFKQETEFSQEDVINQVGNVLNDIERFLLMTKRGEPIVGIDQQVKNWMETTLEFRQFRKEKHIFMLLEKNFTDAVKKKNEKTVEEFTVYFFNVFSQGDQLKYVGNGKYRS